MHLIADHGLGIAHLVDDGTTGALTGPMLQAVCGRVFLPAALCAPLGRRCCLCTAVVERTSARDPAARRRRPPWMVRTPPWSRVRS